MNCPAFVKTKGFRILAALVLLTIVSAVIYALYLFNLRHDDLYTVKPAFVLTASGLYDEFEANEAAATAKYSSRVIEIKGTIAEVSYSPSDSTVSIILRDSDAPAGVNCTFSTDNKPKPSLLKVGETITLRGEFSGMLIDVALNNCVLLPGK
ncbi:MAG: hypothetical protein H6538_08085 [Bacteroidales bacterium]|nr:hypothetical protein [Bacteroidales bacterium]MCB9000147.1 hypothetical protein [Bacteroidales bacterium]MCB9013504.1 hypothetical protein [Bacteroidales bacterium]